MRASPTPCPRCAGVLVAEGLDICPRCLFGETDAPTRVGPYELFEELGRGGMGTVYRGRHIELDREVAVKVVAAAFVEGPALARRLEREGKILARLDHPNIVRVFDASTSGDECYIAMELVRGEPLSARLPLLPDQAIAVAIEVCRALEHAHAAGVVHRDVKPQNVLIDSAGVVRLGDFGIARVVGGSDGDPLTTTQTIVGTRHYVAPEALEGAPPDPLMDLYAVGVLLYQAITSNLPVGVFAPIDHPVDTVIRAALAANPAERPQSAAALRRALERARARGRRLPGRAALATVGVLCAAVATTVAVAPDGGALAPPKTFLELRQGHLGYTGAVDTYFGPEPTEHRGLERHPHMRTVRGRSTAVLRFDGLVGSGRHQLPAGAHIVRATLVLHNPTAIQWADGQANAVHRLLVPWQESDGYGIGAWAGGATPGIDYDDREASARPTDTSDRYVTAIGPRSKVIPTDTEIELDVTATVQAWADGAPAYGFVLRGLGAQDALYMATSEYLDPRRRPALRIHFLAR